MGNEIVCIRSDTLLLQSFVQKLGSHVLKEDILDISLDRQSVAV